MKPIFRIAWHFGGLAAAIIGAVQLAGWPAGLFTFGTWAMIATIIDGISVQRKHERV